MMTEGTVAVVPGSGLKTRNRDVDFAFRQDSDFFYLTGFTEEDALLLLAPGREHGETILFCQERDARYESYNGERLGPDRASQVLGVDDAFPMSDMGDILPGLLEGRERVYVTLGEYPDFDSQLMAWVNDIRARESGGAVAPGEFVSLKHHLHELRLYKSAKEMSLMREAAKITSAAHIRAMQACTAGMTELEKLELQENKLGDHVPFEIFRFLKLKELNIGHNDLTGTVLVALYGTESKGMQF